MILKELTIEPPIMSTSEEKVFDASLMWFDNIKKETESTVVRHGQASRSEHEFGRTNLLYNYKHVDSVGYIPQRAFNYTRRVFPGKRCQIGLI